jgi:hypothetical protein
LSKTERKRKDEQVASLIEKSAAGFRRFAKREPERGTMEAEVTALITCVLSLCFPFPPLPVLLSRRKDVYCFWLSHRNLDSDLTFAERAARDASRELNNVETSVSFAKKTVKDLTTAAEGAFLLFPFAFLLSFHADSSLPLQLPRLRSLKVSRTSTPNLRRSKQRLKRRSRSMRRFKRTFLSSPSLLLTLYADNDDHHTIQQYHPTRIDPPVLRHDPQQGAEEPHLRRVRPWVES